MTDATFAGYESLRKKLTPEADSLLIYATLKATPFNRTVLVRGSLPAVAEQLFRFFEPQLNSLILQKPDLRSVFIDEQDPAKLLNNFAAQLKIAKKNQLLIQAHLIAAGFAKQAGKENGKK